MNRTFVKFLGCLVVASLSSTSGCDDARKPDRDARLSKDPDRIEVAPTSPAEAARRLHDYHMARDYDRLAGLIVEEKRRGLIDFLQAVDRVIDANTEMRQVANEAYGGAMADAWSLEAIENNLGIFSADIMFINQNFKGNSAIVTVQEGEAVPLIRAEFEHTHEGWQHRPQSTPRAAIPELTKLAEVISGITSAIQSGQGAEAYIDAFLFRVLPQMGRVISARDANPDSQLTVASGERLKARS